jgi:hypothetical protein
VWYKTDKQAEQFYEMIINYPLNDDVILISKNTGMQEFQVQRVKEHLFFRYHKLRDGVGRFAPDIKIADAWHRLQKGNFVQQDLKLLEHEYFESRFESIYRTNYDTADDAAVDKGRTWEPEKFVSTPDMTWRP